MVVAFTAVFFQSDICSDEALSFRSIPQSIPLTNGPNVMLYDRTVAVLDALEYVSMDKSSPVIAIRLITNKNNPTETMPKHLKAI